MTLLTLSVAVIAFLLFIIVFGWIITIDLLLTAATFVILAALGASPLIAAVWTGVAFLFYSAIACCLLADKYSR